MIEWYEWNGTIFFGTLDFIKLFFLDNNFFDVLHAFYSSSNYVYSNFNLTFFPNGKINLNKLIMNGDLVTWNVMNEWKWWWWMVIFAYCLLNKRIWHDFYVHLNAFLAIFNKIIKIKDTTFWFIHFWIDSFLISRETLGSFQYFGRSDVLYCYILYFDI